MSSKSGETEPFPSPSSRLLDKMLPLLYWVNADTTQALGGMIAAVGFVAMGATTFAPFPDVNGLAISSASNLRGIFIGSRTQFEDMNAHIAAIKLSASTCEFLKGRL